MSAADDEIVELGEGAAPAAAAAEDGIITVGDGDDALPRAARLLEDGSVELALAYPVVLKTREAKTGQVAEQTFDKLVMHRLTGADMRAIGAASDDTRALVAIGKSARIRDSLVRHVFDRMDGSDARAAGDVVSYFLDSGRKIGR